jgi:riboflavin synthase
MFTGIIEGMGIVTGIKQDESSLTFLIQSNLANELNIDESVSHNGVCLTVEAITSETYQVTAVKETLEKTNLGSWKTGDSVNLERAMRMNGRLDGHIVQGHVDGTATCIVNKEWEGSREYSFSFDEKFAPLVIEKGSVCVNGVSLTAYNTSNNSFTVTIIPYTFEHTNFSSLKEGDMVNIEFDVLGKYVLKAMEHFRKG